MSTIQVLPSEATAVLVDCRKAWDAGIGTYIRNVVPRVLRRLPPMSVRVLIAPGTRTTHDYLDSDRLEFVEDAGASFSLVEQWTLRRIVSSREVFWATSLAHPLLWRGPIAATVHDVAQLALEPRLVGGRLVRFAAWLYLGSLRRRAKQLLFISNFTAKEFNQRVGSPYGGTCVTPLGVDPGWFEIPPPAHPSVRPYFISVGSIRPHKNLATLLTAFRQVMYKLPHDLVIVGRQDGFRTRDSGFNELLAPLGERVRFLGLVEDATLRREVAGAAALVFPSLYEGFGLPPLEAMAAGCPVIASRAGAVMEVCGDAARYFDARDPTSLASALLAQAALTTEETQQQVQRGREWASRYSWERTADLTAQALCNCFGWDEPMLPRKTHE